MWEQRIDGTMQQKGIIKIIGKKCLDVENVC